MLQLNKNKNFQKVCKLFENNKDKAILITDKNNSFHTLEKAKDFVTKSMRDDETARFIVLT